MLNRALLDLVHEELTIGADAAHAVGHARDIWNHHAATAAAEAAEEAGDAFGAWREVARAAVSRAVGAAFKSAR